MRTRQSAATAFFAIGFSLFTIWLIPGCAGTAKINFISLNMTAIDPPGTEPWRFDAQQCFWWADETGDFNIAMQGRQ
jgi:hypothetical protein